MGDAYSRKEEDFELPAHWEDVMFVAPSGGYSSLTVSLQSADGFTRYVTFSLIDHLKAEAAWEQSDFESDEHEAICARQQFYEQAMNEYQERLEEGHALDKPRARPEPVKYRPILRGSMEQIIAQTTAEGIDAMIYESIIGKNALYDAIEWKQEADRCHRYVGMDYSGKEYTFVTMDELDGKITVVDESTYVKPLWHAHQIAAYQALSGDLETKKFLGRGSIQITGRNNGKTESTREFIRDALNGCAEEGRPEFRYTTYGDKPPFANHEYILLKRGWHASCEVRTVSLPEAERCAGIPYTQHETVFKLSAPDHWKPIEPNTCTTWEPCTMDKRYIATSAKHPGTTTPVMKHIWASSSVRIDEEVRPDGEYGFYTTIIFYKDQRQGATVSGSVEHKYGRVYKKLETTTWKDNSGLWSLRTEDGVASCLTMPDGRMFWQRWGEDKWSQSDPMPSMKLGDFDPAPTNELCILRNDHKTDGMLVDYIGFDGEPRRELIRPGCFLQMTKTQRARARINGGAAYTDDAYYLPGVDVQSVPVPVQQSPMITSDMPLAQAQELAQRWRAANPALANWPRKVSEEVKPAEPPKEMVSADDFKAARIDFSAITAALSGDGKK